MCRAGPQDGKSVTPGTNGSEDAKEPEGKSVTPGTNGSEYAEEPWEPEEGKSVTPGTNGTPSVANPRARPAAIDGCRPTSKRIVNATLEG